MTSPVAAVDGSPASREALAWAARFAAQHDARFYLFHAVPSQSRADVTVPVVSRTMSARRSLLRYALCSVNAPASCFDPSARQLLSSSVGRTTTTEHGAVRISFVATLPKASLPRALRP